MERLRDSERSRLIRRQRARFGSGSGSVGTMWVMRNAEQPMGRRSASHVTSLLLYISCSTGAEKKCRPVWGESCYYVVSSVPPFCDGPIPFFKTLSLSLSHSLSLTQSHSHTFTLSSILSLTHALCSLSLSLTLSPSVPLFVTYILHFCPTRVWLPLSNSSFSSPMFAETKVHRAEILLPLFSSNMLLFFLKIEAQRFLIVKIGHFRKSIQIRFAPEGALWRLSVSKK